jgi:hypothetical protein
MACLRWWDVAGHHGWAWLPDTEEVPLAAAPPHGGLSMRQAIVLDWPRPPVQLGAVAVRCEHRRSRRPCHLCAISSGHERYAAVSHGHSRRPLRWAPASLTWGGGGGRSCMACKGSRGPCCSWRSRSGLVAESSRPATTLRFPGPAACRKPFQPWHGLNGVLHLYGRVGGPRIKWLTFDSPDLIQLML